MLSGGEKARVALAKTIASKANFLLLDEPTNHLDIHSVDLLTEALQKYEGTIVLVSHDRYFISRVANVIWEIVDNKIRAFKGTYQEYEDWKERREKALAEERKQKEKPEPVAVKPVQQKNEKQQQVTPDNKKELQKYKTRFKQLEEKVALLTKKKTELEALLGTPDIYSDKMKFQKAESDYNLSVKDLAAANEEYEKVFEKIMELE